MADSLGSRDIDLIFRAETNAAQRDVNALAKDVKRLRAELEKQNADIAKGGGSYDALAANMRELKDAQSQLANAASLLKSLNTQAASAEKAQAKVATLTAELAKLRQEQEAGGSSAGRLAQKIETKTRQIERAVARESDLTAAYKAQRAEVEKMIGPIDSFAAKFEAVARASREAAQGVAANTDAMGRTRANLAAGNFPQMAASSPVSSDTINLISQYENRVELLRQATQFLANTSDEARDSAQQHFASVVQGAAQAGANQDQLLTSLQRLNAEARDSALATKYRETAAQARAAVQDVKNFGPAANGAEVASAKLLDTIQAITRESLVATQNLDSVGGVIDNAVTVSEDKKARVSALTDALNALQQAMAGLERQASLVDGLKTQIATTQQAEATYTAARAEVLRLADEMEKAGPAGGQLAGALNKAQLEADQAGASLQRQNAKLAELQAAARKAGIDLNNLAAAESRIAAEATRASGAAGTLTQRLKGGSGSGFLGLNAYEMQNLGYQVNDIFTSLASGQKPMQVLAQQSGQIAQLFPGMWSAMAGGLPILIPLALALGGVALGLGQAAENAAQVKAVDKTLRAVGDAAGYTADGLNGAIDRLEDLGVSSADATAAVSQLARDGLDPARLTEFSEAAVVLAEELGIKVPEAAQKMTDAFSSGKDGILDLNDETQFLTEAERAQIAAMDEATQSQEIRDIAYAAFYERLVQLADQQNGPSVQAANALEGAWSNLLDVLAMDDAYRSVLGWLDNIRVGLAQTINFLAQLLKQFKAKLTPLAVAFAAGPATFLGYIASGGLGDISVSGAWEDAKKDTERDYKRKPLSGGGGGGGGAPRITGGKRGGGGGKKTKKAGGKKKKTGKSDAQRDAERAAKEAARLAKQMENDSDRLTNALDSMTSKALKAQTGGIEEQIANSGQAIDKEYAKIFDDLAEFEAKYSKTLKDGTKVSPSINGVSVADYRAQVEANKAALKTSAALGVYEDAINDALDARADKLALIEDRQLAGLLTPADALAESQKVFDQTDADLESLVNKARDFAEALAAGPEKDSFIAALDSYDAKLGQSGLDARAAAVDYLAKGEAEVNKILTQRDALIAANNALAAAGLITEQQRIEAAKDAYAAAESALTKNASVTVENEDGSLAAPAIVTLGALRAQREALQKAFDENLITPEKFAADMANLDVLEKKLSYVSDRALAVKGALVESFTSGFTTLFEGMANGLAQIALSITGVSDESVKFKDVLSAVGIAAAQFAADVLMSIGRVLMQMAVLQAVSAATGIPVSALAGGETGSGGAVGGILGSIGGFFAKMFHGGGTVGGGSGVMRTSRVTPFDAARAVASAPRYHSGTPGVGLSRDETMAVLKNGEKVLTEDQQRQEAARLKAARASGESRSTGIRQVLAIGEKQIAEAMSTASGEKVVLTVLRNNKATVKDLLA